MTNDGVICFDWDQKQELLATSRRRVRFRGLGLWDPVDGAVGLGVDQEFGVRLLLALKMAFVEKRLSIERESRISER